MDSKGNFMEGLKVLLDKKGWGGNSDHSCDTEEKAIGRLETLVGTLLTNEMGCVHLRNDTLLRAIHFQDRRLTSDFIDVSEYLSSEEKRSQIREAYHRNNILFEAYKQSVNDSNHFPELPNGTYAEERGWGGSPELSVVDRESADKRLEQMSDEEYLTEMESLDRRNDELCRLIHEKETAIANYLVVARESMDEREIREQVKHAYIRNNILFDLFEATSKGEQFLSEFFVREILRRDKLAK